MDWNNNTIGALLIFSGLGLLFWLWIGVISPNIEMRNLWSLIVTIFWIQLQEYNPAFWIILDDFKIFIFSVSILVVVSMPVEIFGVNIEIFFYISVGLILAGAIAALTGSR